MKNLLIFIAILVFGGLLFVFWSPASPQEVVQQSSLAEEIEDYQPTPGTLPDGQYVLSVEESVFQWAGQKPLIDGYINSGSVAFIEGTLSVGGNEIIGSFVLDMNTLSVSDTPKKPDAESTLESHLKGERWFDVATYPRAEILVNNATHKSGETYDVDAVLTMHGETHDLSFVATITPDESGRLVTEASFEFDRTLWGITAGSGSFFDNLEDNIVDDMVAVSLRLVAEELE